MWELPTGADGADIILIQWLWLTVRWVAGGRFGAGPEGTMWGHSAGDPTSDSLCNFLSLFLSVLRRLVHLVPNTSYTPDNFPSKRKRSNVGPCVGNVF
jgi:hypothetical protein